MAEKKIKAQVPGFGTVDAFEVGVDQSTERWSEITLMDGSVIRIKPIVIGAMRVEGKYDQEGNPVYSLKVNQVMVVASSPEHLRKGATVADTKH